MAFRGCDLELEFHSTEYIPAFVFAMRNGSQLPGVLGNLNMEGAIVIAELLQVLPVLILNIETRKSLLLATIVGESEATCAGTFFATSPPFT